MQGKCRERRQALPSAISKAFRWSKPMLMVIGMLSVCATASGQAVQIPKSDAQAERVVVTKPVDMANDDAWFAIKHFLGVMQGLTVPVPPDELADMLGLNKRERERAKTIRPFPSAPGSRLLAERVQYENVPENNNDISVDLYIITSKNAKIEKNIHSENVGFTIHPLKMVY